MLDSNYNINIDNFFLDLCRYASDDDNDINILEILLEKKVFLKKILIWDYTMHVITKILIL